MFKALVKSRWQATLSALLHSGRKGGRRSGGALVGYGLLMLYVAFCVLILFFMMASTLCRPLTEAGLGWLYFAVMGVMALALGVIGSVFTAQTQLYEARDNEMLLAMPIPPSYLLGSRMLALYGQSFLCGAVVFVPTLVAYLRVGAFHPLGGLAFGLAFLLLPLLSLTLSCILGWLVALIASRMRRTRDLVCAAVAGASGGVFLPVQQGHTYLQLLIATGEAVGDAVRRTLYPLYQLGRACMGSGTALGLFALCTVVPFGIVYWILGRSFVKIATARRGAAKIRYRERTLKSAPRTEHCWPGGAASVGQSHVPAQRRLRVGLSDHRRRGRRRQGTSVPGLSAGDAGACPSGCRCWPAPVSALWSR